MLTPEQLTHIERQVESTALRPVTRDELADHWAMHHVWIRELLESHRALTARLAQMAAALRMPDRSIAGESAGEFHHRQLKAAGLDVKVGP